MKIIRQYPLKIHSGYQSLYMPRGARNIAVKEKEGRLVMYSYVDLHEALSPHKLAVVKTDDPFPDMYRFKYIDTVLMTSGYECHVFEELIPN